MTTFVAYSKDNKTVTESGCGCCEVDKPLSSYDVATIKENYFALKDFAAFLEKYLEDINER